MYIIVLLIFSHFVKLRHRELKGQVALKNYCLQMLHNSKAILKFNYTGKIILFFRNSFSDRCNRIIFCILKTTNSFQSMKTKTQ